MNSNLGKPLSKKEMKTVQGGKLPGCAMHGQNGVAYSRAAAQDYSSALQPKPA